MTRVVTINGQKRLVEYRGLDTNGVPVWLLVSNAPKTRRAKLHIPYKGNHRLGLMPYGKNGAVIWVSENSLLGHVSAQMLSRRMQK